MSGYKSKPSQCKATDIQCCHVMENAVKQLTGRHSEATKNKEADNKTKRCTEIHHNNINTKNTLPPVLRRGEEGRR
ncbi:hypothetical protein E2C01_068539 [Portunus trituberculatus]|uniref:Uncharacterized protein n=1 Tax=Portunus trituberculatus TaxID=210409 RepID=A0A5B7HWQ4_PORTR|nr:hypothetical protein [Portunus trituberculatus]